MITGSGILTFYKNVIGENRPISIEIDLSYDSECRAYSGNGLVNVNTPGAKTPLGIGTDIPLRNLNASRERIFAVCKNQRSRAGFAQWPRAGYFAGVGYGYAGCDIDYVFTLKRQRVGDGRVCRVCGIRLGRQNECSKRGNYRNEKF